MKKKVLQVLKTKYSKLGLSTSTLDSMADVIASKLTEESSDDDIEAEVSGVENLLQTFQTDVDKRVTDAVKKAKGAQSQHQDDPPPGNDPKSKDEPNDIAKAIQAAIAPLVQKVEALQGEKVKATRQQQLDKALEKVDPKIKAKAIKDFGRMKFDSDEDFQSYLDDTIADIGEIGSIEPPKPGGVRQPIKGGGKPDDKATQDEINAVVDSII